MSNDPLEHLRREARPALPTDADTRRARTRLQATIDAEKARPRPASRRWLAAVAVVAAATLVVVIVGLLRPAAATAALTEVAQAARTATPQDVPQGSLVLVSSTETNLALRPGTEFGTEREYVAYLIGSRRQVWTSPHSDFIRIDTTNTSVEFFDTTLEAAYYQNHLDQTDHLGQTQSEQFTDAQNPTQTVHWPAQPDALEQALVDYAAQGADPRPQSAQVLALAVDILREANPPPALRAALLEVIARLPLRIVDRSNDRLTVALDYDQPQPTRETITLDHQGWLLAETRTLIQGNEQLGIPAGTITFKADYQLPRVVDSLP